MKTEGVKREGYTMIYNVYEAGVDFEPSDDLVTLKCLAKYNLHKGYRIWRIGATQADKRHMKCRFYFVVSTSKVDAMNKFLNIVPWPAVVKSVTQLSDGDTKMILAKPAKFILW